MKKILFIILIFKSFLTFSQNVKLSKNQLNANLLPLTLSYEGRIDNNKSFTISGGITPSITVESRTNGIDTETNVYAFLHPYFTGSFRNYYKRNRVKKKDLGNNSGNYFGIFYLSS